jgi:hypothetical protein
MEAVDLVMSGQPDDLGAVLANRFRTNQRVIALCLVVEGVRHQWSAASLRHGILSALQMGKDAESAVLADAAEVA